MINFESFINLLLRFRRKKISEEQKKKDETCRKRILEELRKSYLEDKISEDDYNNAVKSFLAIPLNYHYSPEEDRFYIHRFLSPRLYSFCFIIFIPLFIISGIDLFKIPFLINIELFNFTQNQSLNKAILLLISSLTFLFSSLFLLTLIRNLESDSDFDLIFDLLKKNMNYNEKRNFFKEENKLHLYKIINFSSKILHLSYSCAVFYFLISIFNKFIYELSNNGIVYLLSFLFLIYLIIIFFLVFSQRKLNETKNNFANLNNIFGFISINPEKHDIFFKI